MATERARFMISVDDEMYQKMVDYRFDNRFNTMSEATVSILQLGLEVIEKQAKEKGGK